MYRFPVWSSERVGQHQQLINVEPDVIKQGTIKSRLVFIYYIIQFCCFLQVNRLLFSFAGQI